MTYVPGDHKGTGRHLQASRHTFSGLTVAAQPYRQVAAGTFNPPRRRGALPMARPSSGEPVFDNLCVTESGSEWVALVSLFLADQS